MMTREASNTCSMDMGLTTMVPAAVCLCTHAASAGTGLDVWM